ncbi:hypothetical protein PO124_30320 [Bacillus licheniformis]|nr:hypothetical protein [Bacillus licheniformis]
MLGTAQKEELLEDLCKTETKISSLSQDDFAVTELLSAADLLSEELFSKEPRTYLIKALLDYLGKSRPSNTMFHKYKRLV